MTEQEMYDKLNDADSLHELEAALTGYLKDQLAKGDAQSERQRDIAYNLAGLLSTKAIMATPDESLYKVALLLAGQLELPVEQRSADATWEKLAAIIRGL